MARLQVLSKYQQIQGLETTETGNGLEGDMGEIVSQIFTISPNIEPRQKIFLMCFL
jgi:hypothetical protein